MAAAAELQFDFASITAEFDLKGVGECRCRPSQARNFFRLLEETRHAPEFRVPIFFPALFNELSCRLAGDNMLGAECTRTKNPHCVIVGEDKVFDGLLRVLTELREPVSRRRGRRPRFDADEEVLSFDRPHIGVALCGECINALRQYLERLFFRRRISRRCERFAHNALFFLASFRIPLMEL